MGLWEDDAIQFPRLLAEIRTVGFTKSQYRHLRDSMDLPDYRIDEILERAEVTWQEIKERQRLRSKRRNEG